MQSVRHCSRRFLWLLGTNRTSPRVFSTEASSNSKARRSKEEKHELAVKFVERFKAENDGKLPGITALRKEIGGSYDALKEIMESIQKRDASHTTSSDIRKAGGNEEPSISALRSSSEENPSLHVGKKKDTAEEPSLKSSKAKEKNPQGQGNLVSKHLQGNQNRGLKDVGIIGGSTSSIMKKPISNASEKKVTKSGSSSKDGVTSTVISAKGASQNDVIDSDEEDDDSDVAAPEYSNSGNLSVGNPQNAIKQKNFKSEPVKLKKAEAPDVNIKSQFTKPRIHEAVNADFSGSNAVNGTLHSTLGSGDVSDSNRHPTVFRISNLPLQASEESVRALCGTIAHVHELEFRKKGTVDVQFNIRNDSEARAVLDRLRDATLDNRNLKAFIAPRFYCGKTSEKQLKPKNANQLKHIREVAINNFEQCFRQLYARVQDYRELMAMKRDL